MIQPTFSTEPIREDERFNVVFFYVDGEYHYEHRAVPIERAMESVKFAAGSVAVHMQWLTRMLITDMLDRTCLEWKLHEGIVFPPVGSGKT